MYGLDVPPIAEYFPTELPVVEVTDRIADRIFRLVDGSYAIVDFVESAYRKKNKTKYLHYAARVAEKYAVVPLGGTGGHAGSPKPLIIRPCRKKGNVEERPVIVHPLRHAFLLRGLYLHIIAYTDKKQGLY